MKQSRRESARAVQTSESFLLASLLALSGGLQDAYTYNVRGRVFANAQTGNIVLMSQDLVTGQWLEALRYLMPIMAFVLGILLTELIRRLWHDERRLHWRQLVLLWEIAVLALVGFLPEGADSAAAMLVSFTCAMQVEAFRKIHGYGYASTMCIGNLRSGTEELFHYLRGHEHAHWSKALCYYGIILLFAVGAALGALASLHLARHAIWLSCLLLTAALLLMTREYR